MSISNKQYKRLLAMTEQGKVTCEFHNALVQSLANVSEEEGIGIYDLIKILIFEMNRVIHASEVKFGPSPVFNWLQLLRDKKYHYKKQMSETIEHLVSTLNEVLRNHRQANNLLQP